MLRRIILALLIACVGFPAAAMPMLHARMGHMAEAPQMMTPAHRHAMPASHHEHGMAGDMAGQTHECIGCIARYDGVALPDAPALPLPVGLCRAVPAQLVGDQAGPETPPPRC